MGSTVSAVSTQAKKRPDVLLQAGIATAIFVPIIGFIIGVVLLTKDRVGPGLACVLLSIFVPVIVYYVGTN